MYVGNYGNDSIVVIPTSGPQSTFATGLTPNSIAFNSAGDLYAVNKFAGDVYEYAPGGGSPTLIAQGLNNPEGLAVNSAGDLFVATQDNFIYEFAPGGGTPTVFASASSGLNVPYALAFNSAGDLFVGNLAGDVNGAGFIQEFGPGGGTPTLFASGLNTPGSLAFNATGDLFVSEGNLTDTILEYNHNGGAPTIFANGLDNNAGLAFNSAGNLFVADSGDNDNGNITELSPTGSTLNVITTVPEPRAIAFQGVALPVPEPSTLALAAIGAAALLLRRWKQS